MAFVKIILGQRNRRGTNSNYKMIRKLTGLLPSQYDKANDLVTRLELRRHAAKILGGPQLHDLC